MVKAIIVSKFSEIKEKNFQKLELETLWKKCGFSNNNDCYTPQDIKKQFKDKKNTPDLFINVGVLNKKKPSTIIKCDNNKLEVLRKGEIKVKI